MKNTRKKSKKRVNKEYYVPTKEEKQRAKEAQIRLLKEINLNATEEKNKF